MKHDKGGQVFTGDTNEVLAKKIIKHSENNSRDSSTTQPNHLEKTLLHTLKNFFTLLLVIASTAAIFMLISIVLRKNYQK